MHHKWCGCLFTSQHSESVKSWHVKKKNTYQCHFVRKLNLCLAQGPPWRRLFLLCTIPLLFVGVTMTLQANSPHYIQYSHNLLGCSFNLHVEHVHKRPHLVCITTLVHTEQLNIVYRNRSSLVQKKWNIKGIYLNFLVKWFY